MSAPLTTPPSGPRPPDSRVRWHLVAAAAGSVLAPAVIWCSSAAEHPAVAIAGALGAALLWALAASQSSLGYLVPGLALGVLGLLHAHATWVPGIGEYLGAPITGVLVVISLGLAASVHFARRDGRDIVLNDELAAAVHASQAPASRTRRHVITSIGAAVLTLGACGAREFWNPPAIDAAPGTSPWNLLVALLLFAAAATLGGLSSIALVVAGVVGFALLAIGHAVPAAEPDLMAVASLMFLTGALSCRLARRAGTRVERRERAAVN